MISRAISRRLLSCARPASRALPWSSRLSTSIRLAHIVSPEKQSQNASSNKPVSNPHATGKSPADQAYEDIAELFATARDEFDIAMEETENATIYAQDDRDAARAELEKVKTALKKILEGGDSELKQLVSKRGLSRHIKELELGVQRMEEMATEHD